MRGTIAAQHGERLREALGEDIADSGQMQVMSRLKPTIRVVGILQSCRSRDRQSSTTVFEGISDKIPIDTLTLIWFSTTLKVSTLLTRIGLVSFTAVAGDFFIGFTLHWYCVQVMIMNFRKRDQLRQSVISPVLSLYIILCSAGLFGVIDVVCY